MQRDVRNPSRGYIVENTFSFLLGRNFHRLLSGRKIYNNYYGSVAYLIIIDYIKITTNNGHCGSPIG